jgi:Alpha/beta hydrolase domain
MLRRIAVILFCAAALNARITRIVVEHRAPQGKPLTGAGQYELLTGIFYGELDPKDLHNTIINDIALAPAKAGGKVEYTATFALAKPVDMLKSSGVLYYLVPNRGNGSPALYDEGHVTVVSGWQGDLPPRAGTQYLTVPIARNRDGSSITGPVIQRIIDVPAGQNAVDLRTRQYFGLTYQFPATLDTSKANLTRRRANSEPVLVPSAEWAFADCAATAFPGVPDPSHVCLKSGFDPAAEYLLKYTAKDPLVLGIGYAATRDLNSFLRYSDKDDAGNPNPVAHQIRWTMSRGDSQSGNFIRSFINLGFNQDESNRIVWDGAIPHIAARQLALNFRFAIAGGAAGPFQPGSESVLWWSDYEDKVRGRRTAGLLDRCHKSDTCPKIFETFGALEFWYLRESPNLVGTDAKSDIPLPPNVRRYFFPGTSHGGGRGGFSAAAPNPPNGCTLPANPNPEADTMAALRVAMIAWISKSIEPPPSRYPKLSQLALPERVAFPSIPGVPSPANLVNPLYDYDFGPEFNYGDLSGVITRNPPTIKRALPTLVPKVDADGSDIGGVPSVLHQVPLGSYLGWNITADGFDKGKICQLSGAFIPFAKTKAEREINHDPRLSLEERYGTHEHYVELVKNVASQAVADRFLLAPDAERLIAEAGASTVLKE